MDSVLQENQNIPSQIQRRSVPLSIFLSVITCGLYFLYWYAKVSKETAQMVGEEVHRGGALTVLFHLITGGLFSSYWFYKVPHKLNELRSSVGLKAQRLSKSVWVFCLWMDSQITSFFVFLSMLLDDDINADLLAIDVTTDSGKAEFLGAVFLVFCIAWVLSILFFFLIPAVFAFFSLDTKLQTNYAIAAFFNTPVMVAVLQANLNNYLLYLDRKERGCFERGESDV